MNKVVRHKGANYRERWQALYYHFSVKYHMNLNARKVKWYALNKPRSASMLDYIDRGLGMIPELYDIACKLYEGDINQIIAHYEAIR